jgi:hypothetical protein
MTEVIFYQMNKQIHHLNYYCYHFHSSIKMEEDIIGSVKIEELVMQNAPPEWICAK